MWIPEPLLKLSYSGAAPLAAFLQEVERKAAVARAKETRKTAPEREVEGWPDDTYFFRQALDEAFAGTQSDVDEDAEEFGVHRNGSARATIRKQHSSGAPHASTAESAKRDAEGHAANRVRPCPQIPRRQLQSSPWYAQGILKQTSLPNTAEQAHLLSSDVEIDELDSSIEFLGAFVSSSTLTSAGGVHDRSSTPPATSDSDAAARRPNKSPKKSLHTSSTASVRSSGRKGGELLPSQRALAEPVSDDEDESVRKDIPSFGATLAKSMNRPKPRTSAITISDSSDGEI